MIDASLAAAIAAAPAGSAPEPAPADGFGDLLGQLLAATTAAMEQVAAATLTVAAEAATPAGNAGTGTVGGADAPAAGGGAEVPAGNTGGTEQAATVTLGALVLASPRAAGTAAGGKDQDVARGGEQADGVDAMTELPEQARDAKAASAAWHAAQSARAQAPVLSAVVLAAAPDAPASAPAAPGGTIGGSAAQDTAITGLDAPAAPAPAATPQERRDARAEARMEAPAEAGNTQAAVEHHGAEQALADIAATRLSNAERPRAQGAQANAPVSGIDGAASQAGESAATAAEVAQAGPSTELFASGALRRVLEAVEAAEHRPPPNTMAVDIPGEGAEDALRLMVTVRGTVVEVSTQGERGLPPGWARPLAEALEQRGMTLDGFGAQDAAARGRGDAAGDERRDGRPRATPRERAALAPARATQTLSTASDGALRL